MSERMFGLVQDLSAAVKVTTRAPAHSLLVVLILALGIGATVTVFTLVDQTLLRPAPFRDGERLVDVLDVRRGGGGGSILTPEKVLGWQQEASVFEGFEAYSPRTFDLSSGAHADRVPGLVVSTGLFDLLGVLPVAGRLFAPEEGRPGSAPVVVVSERLARRYGWAPVDAVGRAVTLNDEPATIVGVLPTRFSLQNAEVLWAPFELAAHAGGPAAPGFFGIARLRPGLSVIEAQASVYTISDRRQAVQPLRRSWDLRLDPKRAASMAATTRTALVALLAAAATLLLLTCANVTLLLLTRMASREAELVVRSAMGASRGRLIQQELLHTAILALAGGLGGLLMAWWAVELVVAAAPSNLVALGTIPIRVDPRVALVAIATTCGVALLCGLLPAWRGSGARLEGILRQMSGTTGTRGERWAFALLALQFATSITLLAGAGLMLRTIVAIAVTPPGFDPNGLVTMHVDLPTDRYATPTTRQAFLDALDARLRQVPGIRDVAFARGLTSAGFGAGTLETEQGVPQEDAVLMSMNVVSPSFFSTLRLPVLQGRTFIDGDEVGSHVIINKALAARLWPNESAVGRRFTPDRGARGGWLVVVGVVGDVDARISSDRRLTYQLYEPWPSALPPQPAGVGQRSYARHMLLVRADNPDAIPAIVRDVVRGLDPRQPVERIVAADEALRTMYAREYFMGRLVVGFALLGLVLAGTSTFGVLSHAARRRSREVAIRIAVGASPRQVTRLLLRRIVPCGLLGSAAGVVGGAGLGRVMGALLHGVSPTDPVSLALAALTLTATGVASAWWPVRQAVRADPVTALRAEG